MKTIIYTHPYNGSFNHAILETMTNYFDTKNEPYQVIDLYQDNFNPALSPIELKKYSSGEVTDPLVSKYQKIIMSSDELIFIFPIWWHNLPAMLKGFLDKTMLANFAYNEENGWTGLLNNIKKSTVITTSTITKDYLVNQSGNPIQGVFINRTLADMGIDPQTNNWIHFGEVNLTTDKVRADFLNELPKLYEN